MPRTIPPILDVPAPALPLTVVGDIHLCAEEPEVVEAFLGWLEARASAGGTLVLLGDVFDLWVNKKQQDDPIPRRVLDALGAVQDAGVHLIFMCGNRDVAFAGVDGLPLEIWPDPVRTRLGAQVVVLTHGDQLCTADHGYQALRRFFQGLGGVFLVHGLPYRVQRFIGDGTRQLSLRETGRKPRADMGIDYGEALRWMECYDADAIVAGHVHTGVHHRHPGPPTREILVLKDWEAGGSVIHFDGDGLALRTPGAQA
jgi:UDP-2,3-diacylglucosamine hydrolase